MLRQLGVPLTGGALDGLLAEFADIYGVFSSADTGVTVSCSSAEPSFIYKRLAELSEGDDIPAELLGPAIASEDAAAADWLRGVFPHRW